MPSPAIATMRPSLCSRRTSSSLSAGGNLTLKAATFISVGDGASLTSARGAVSLTAGANATSIVGAGSSIGSVLMGDNVRLTAATSLSIDAANQIAIGAGSSVIAASSISLKADKFATAPAARDDSLGSVVIGAGARIEATAATSTLTISASNDVAIRSVSGSVVHTDLYAGSIAISAGVLATAATAVVAGVNSVTVGAGARVKAKNGSVSINAAGGVAINGASGGAAGAEVAATTRIL